MSLKEWRVLDSSPVLCWESTTVEGRYIRQTGNGLFGFWEYDEDEGYPVRIKLFETLEEAMKYNPKES